MFLCLPCTEDFLFNILSFCLLLVSLSSAHGRSPFALSEDCQTPKENCHGLKENCRAHKETYQTRKENCRSKRRTAALQTIHPCASDTRRHCSLLIVHGNALTLASQLHSTGSAHCSSRTDTCSHTYFTASQHCSLLILRLHLLHSACSFSPRCAVLVKLIPRPLILMPLTWRFEPNGRGLGFRRAKTDNPTLKKPGPGPQATAKADLRQHHHRRHSAPTTCKGRRCFCFGSYWSYFYLGFLVIFGFQPIHRIITTLSKE